MKTSVVNVERSCVKCASPRTRIMGQSISPAVLHVTCDNCGYSSVVPGPAAPRQAGG